MLSLLLLRSWRRRRRMLSECQSQDSQHLQSSSSSQYHYHHGQTDKTVARSISHLFIRPPQQQSHSHLRHLLLLGSLSRHSSSPPSSLSASLPTYSRGTAAEFGPGRTRTSKEGYESKSRETGTALGRRAAAASALVRIRSNLHGFLRARPVEG